MSRIQLALNVTDLAASIDFYRAVLGTEPAKVREGYANFAVADPPLKLVLLESDGASGGSLNHLGIEVADTEQVLGATERLRTAGLPVDERSSETCCYATQDKVWVHDPDGAPWEVYTVLGDADRLTSDAGSLPPEPAAAACC